MLNQSTGLDALHFARRQRTRLRVTLRMLDFAGNQILAHNTDRGLKDDSLDGSLRSAQQEVVEQEIFSILIQEAPNLLTATARVSERLIFVDAAQNLELIFAMVRAQAWRLCSC